ncbi:MAG: carboxymuconolactone decarboxylase family protein [Moritella sp.]|uniref:carboxymuconolactone decarboxylase family protein n=1 Tax=Moritella sp. TaxID=78556 RepID=UPI001E08B8F9|nr:carboxymuconolactone decarboxylase family protein [Moritella sp.]NQZ50573.1 carboxymuconolactone decarboxylase family protein [Moritella sp.]
MTNRININELEPAAYQPMFGLEAYLSATDLEPKLKELIKIKASITNQCAYCVQMHTEQARKQGETEQRLYALSVWQESPLFTDTERAVLALTEEVTLISASGVSDETYSRCLALLGEHTLAQCIMQIVTINMWNRIALATKMQH